jgi:hypothetical protein
MIVPNGYNNDNWQNARIEDFDNEPEFQPLERQFAHAWDDDWNAQPVGRMPGEDWGPHPLDGLPWDHPDVLAVLAREAEENEAAQELYEPLNLYVDYTIPAGDDEDCDPRIEHVPPLSRQHGDQICELALDGMQIIFHKKNAGNRTDETLEFPAGFHGLKCKFFDADGTLCVMVFEVDGVNTLIYDFFTGQILGGGPMPEAIDWTTDSLRKVSLIEGEGLQVVVTNDAEGIRNITIGG